MHKDLGQFEKIANRFITEVRELIAEKEETLSTVIDECERLQKTLLEKNAQISELELQIQLKSDDLIAKDLELHRLDTIGSRLEDSSTTSMIVDENPKNETPKSKKRPKPKSGQTSLKSYMLKDKRKNRMSPSPVKEQHLETMFDEDETFIDTALDIYRGKSISPKTSETSDEHMADHAVDSTSPIIQSNHRKDTPVRNTGNRSAKDLLFGSQISSDDEVEITGTIAGTSKPQRKKRSSDQAQNLQKTGKKIKEEKTGSVDRKEKSLGIDFSLLRRAREGKLTSAETKFANEEYRMKRPKVINKYGRTDPGPKFWKFNYFTQTQDETQAHPTKK